MESSGGAPRNRCPRCNVPRSLSQYAARPWKQRKSSIFRKNWEGVTILQWSKRFDATLGVCACWWRFRYFDELLRRAATAQSSGEDSSSHCFIELCLLPSTVCGNDCLALFGL